MQPGPPEQKSPLGKIFRKFRLGFVWQVLILVFLTVMIHSAGLWRGRILDDFFVLEKCQEMPLGKLVAEGLTVGRTEAGDFWWIGSAGIMSYFRPLLLLTYKLPAMLFSRPDAWQHLINLLLQLAMVLLVLSTARRLTQDPGSAFIAALLFAVGSQHLLAVQWISGRKEPLVAFFLLLAFLLHVSSRRVYASLALLMALLSGEQAVVFPIMAMAWDIFSGNGVAAKEKKRGRSRGRYTAWLGYWAVLAVYFALRALIFRGAGAPAVPYYMRPFSPGYIPQAFFKFIHLLFSLVTSAPYLDKILVENWISHPLFLALCVLLVFLLLLILRAAAPRSRRCPALLLLAILSYLPFISMAAIPFYMYTPSLFFALAMAEVLADPGRRPQPGIRFPGKIAIFWATTLIVLNLGGSLVLSWSRAGDFLKLPSEILYKTASLLAEVPKERRVLFVDIPAEFPPAFFHFPKLLAEFTGRDAHSLAVICDRPGGADTSSSTVKPLGNGGFIVRSVGRPYFHTPGGRVLWLFPENVMTLERSFSRSWYSVTIKDLAPRNRLFSRGRRFFSKDEGITALEVRTAQDDPPPIVIGYKNGEPYILLDLKDSAPEVAPPPAPAKGKSGFLLAALSDKKRPAPRPLRMPDRLVPVAGAKMGLGPLLKEMTEKVPAFERAYVGFLRYLDDLNTQLSRAGGGIFRMEASNIGNEYYARSIEIIGGQSRVTIKSNEFGVTWDTLMEKARQLARDSLQQEAVDLSEADGRTLINLIALGQIAAIVNEVIPVEYESEWNSRHPERPRPVETPPKGIPRPYWDGIRNSIPYMYHAGALPWRDANSANPLEAFDTDHFFSHAWLVNYGLYRFRCLHGGLAEKDSPAKNLGQSIVQRQLAGSELASYGYELLSVFTKAGLIELTAAEHLPGFLRRFCRSLGIKAFPIVESVRDISQGKKGAIYGAALAVSGLPLKPSETLLHQKIIDNL
jgi:hypothetical protein